MLKKKSHKKKKNKEKIFLCVKTHVSLTPDKKKKITAHPCAHISMYNR